MQDSLKAKLYDALKAKYPGYLTIDEVETICKDHKNKISNGERRLRASESPRVSRIKNDKGAIIGYKWIAEANQPLQYKTPKEVIIDGLNGQIQTLLDSFNGKDYWTNSQEILRINKIKNGNNEYQKKTLLTQYGIRID